MNVTLIRCVLEQAVTTDTNPMDTTQTTNKVIVNPIITVKTESKDLKKEKKTKDDSSNEDDTLIKSYLGMDSVAYATHEHDAFKAAKKQLLKISHDKTTKVRKHSTNMTSKSFATLLCCFGINPITHHLAWLSEVTWKY